VSPGSGSSYSGGCPANNWECHEHCIEVAVDGTLPERGPNDESGNPTDGAWEDVYCKCPDQAATVTKSWQITDNGTMYDPDTQNKPLPPKEPPPEPICGISNVAALLGGTVWRDLNGDGVRQGHEPALLGYAVQFTAPGPDSTFGTPDDIAVGTRTTDANGVFVLNSLRPGPYRMTPIVLSPSFITTGNSPYIWNLLSGQDHLTPSFGVEVH
jgi:hypothetical protein